VVVLAGGRPDPALTGSMQPKAFAPVGGRAIVERVLGALRATPRIGRIALVGPRPLPPAVAALVNVPVEAPGELLANVAAGLAALGDDSPVLAAAADIPLLTPRAVDAFLAAAEALDADVAYGIVPREDVVREFPGVRKTFVRLRDGTFTGGSLVWMRPPAFQRARALIEQAVRARKRPWDLARLFGPWALLGLATGRLRIAELEAHVTRVAGLRARAAICRCPEIAIDVDGPEMLGWVRQRLGERGTAAARPRDGTPA
jgi:GTP:adenosylcobinamide-phosphate guanylyltransferase